MKSFRLKKELKVNLSLVERNFVLSAFPKSTAIVEAHYFDNYDLPCPIKVKLVLPNKKHEIVVLRKARHGSVQLEAEVLKLLSKYKLPVPKILAESKNSMLLISLLEGENIQHFSMRSKINLKKSKQLLFKALNILENVTNKIINDAPKELLPQYTLLDELNVIINKKPWNSNIIFKNAVNTLKPILKKVSTPLVFTNGDYQPANFLTNGQKITGFIDFEKACFRDPLMGLAKFPIYDLRPLNKAGFANYYLEGNKYTNNDFMIRIALFSLVTLQKEIPVNPKNNEDLKYQKHVLKSLEEAIKILT